MDRLNIIRSRISTPSVLVSSGLHPTTRTAGLGANTADVRATTRMSAAVQLTLERSSASQHLRTGSRATVWAKIGKTLNVEGMPAARQPANQAEPIAANAENRADTASAPPAVKEPPAITKIELTIDSLGNYELNKPIPVFVESLGNRHFVAEVPDLNISTSANSLSEILIILKERVTQTYDTLRIRKNLDGEQTRQLKVLESYIGRSRRGWLDRR